MLCFLYHHRIRVTKRLPVKIQKSGWIQRANQSVSWRCIRSRYFARRTCWRRATDFSQKVWRRRNSRKTPVRSNFFLNFLRALSIDSFSLIGTMIMLFFCIGVAKLQNPELKANYLRISREITSFESRRSLPRWCTVWSPGRISQPEILCIPITAKDLYSVRGDLYRDFRRVIFGKSALFCAFLPDSSGQPPEGSGVRPPRSWWPYRPV